MPTAVRQAGPDQAVFTLGGSLEALRQSTLRAQVARTVLHLSVKAGDRAKAAGRRRGSTNATLRPGSTWKFLTGSGLPESPLCGRPMLANADLDGSELAPAALS